MYAPQLTRMSELLRTDHCTSKCNSQFNSVYCYGDGPVLEPSHKTVQRPRKSATFDSRESNTSASSADKIGSQGTDVADGGTAKNNKRQKLLAWLKASQAKRDENNRQVFSRWIEKIDSERPKGHSASHHGPTFYCDQFPQPQMLVSAMQSYAGGSAGVPLIYVGYPPASIPSHAENLTAYNFGQMKSHLFPFGNSVIHNQDQAVPPVMRPISPTERVGSSVSFKFDQNPSFEPCEVKPEGNPTRVEADPSQSFEILSSNDQRSLSSPMAVPTIISNSSNCNYIDSQMMFFMPYMGYNQGQSPAMPLPNAGTVSDLKNLSSSRLATPFCPSPFMTPDGQMPMFMLGQMNNWYNGTGANQSCNFSIPPSSPQNMSLGTCGQYTPNMNRYLYQPAGTVATGESSQPATSSTPGSNFDFQHWMSALDEIGKDHHRNTISETPETASTLE
ncbi:hypothetical protein AAHC03_05357 [Spirometra sp. Aus1]